LTESESSYTFQSEMSARQRITQWLDSFAGLVRRSYDDTLSVVSTDDSNEMPDAKELAQRITFQVPTNDTQIVRNHRDTPQQETDEQKHTREVMERAFGDSNSFRDVRGLTGLANGRQSIESDLDMSVASGAASFLILNADPNQFDVFNLSERYIRGLKPSKLLELLSEASPEMSRALFDFIMMSCSGWEVDAIDDNEKPIDVSTQYLDDCMNRLRENYGAPEVLFVKYFMSIFLRGAVASELVLSKRGTDFVDIAAIDPESLEHHRERDATRGLVWRIYQRQGGELVDLNTPQVAYLPVHPFFKTNRGRPLAQPAIFVCFFLIATLQDLRRVIRQQGYPRVDISINIESLKRMIPAAQAANMQAVTELGNKLVKEVKAIYSQLKPDDTFVHTEVVTVNQPVGTMNHNSLGIVGDLISALERMATRALKTMPLLMATTDGVSEANANRQWEIHVAGIKSMQHYVESVLEKHGNLALRAKGLLGHTRFRFSELRAAELLRDAQVELINTTIARQQYDNGSINADEMAKKSAGKDKADAPEPRVAKIANAGFGPGGTAFGASAAAAQNTNAEPGASRVADAVLSGFMRMTAKDIAEAKGLFEQYAPEPAKGLLSAKLYQEEE
jgi:hypothetical protein